MFTFSLYKQLRLCVAQVSKSGRTLCLFFEGYFSETTPLKHDRLHFDKRIFVKLCAQHLVVYIGVQITNVQSGSLCAQCVIEARNGDEESLQTSR